MSRLFISSDTARSRMENFMNLAAIIAEYNPLHNGHSWHIAETKQVTGADGIIVLLSGCFVQRGEPAIYDKYLRTRTALLAGADVVLELPTVSACGSAEYFADGAIRILNGLGCVSRLSFGCETDDLATLQQLVSFLAEESSSYKQALRDALASGLSFAAAREQAVRTCLGEQFTPAMQTLLSSPNSTLALEYLLALHRTHSRIQPFLVKRNGSGYSDAAISEGQMASATALRRAILLQSSAIQAPDSQTAPFSVVSEQMPADCAAFLKHTNARPLFPEDASVLLQDRLAHLSEDIFDFSPELQARMRANLRTFHSWSEWCDLLKTRQYTYTRISRALCHALLDLRESEIATFRADPNCCYGRILGLKKGSAVPAQLKKSSSIPLITKLADVSKAGLSGNAQTQLSIDIEARNLYRLIYWQKYRETLPDEYQSGIIIE